MMSAKFHSDPRLICEVSPRFLRLTGFFQVRLFNDVSHILPRPTPVAMATKFELKLVITQLVSDISPRFLHLKRRFKVGLLNDVSQSLPRPTFVAMATNFEPQLAITRLV